MNWAPQAKTIASQACLTVAARYLREAAETEDDRINDSLQMAAIVLDSVGLRLDAVLKAMSKRGVR